MNVREFDQSLYTFRGRYLRAVDGDTIAVSLSLGFNLYADVHLRLRGFNAAERYTPEGRIASQRVIDLFASDRYTGAMLEMRGFPLRVVTLKRDDGGETKSFERYVADVFLCDEAGEMTNLVDLLQPEAI